MTKDISTDNWLEIYTMYTYNNYVMYINNFGDTYVNTIHIPEILLRMNYNQ